MVNSTLLRDGMLGERPLGPYGIAHPCGNSALDCQLLRHTDNIGVDPLVGYALAPVEPPSETELAVRPADEAFWAASDAAFRCPADSARDQVLEAAQRLRAGAQQVRARPADTKGVRAPPLKALDAVKRRVRAIFAPHGQKLCGLAGGGVSAGLTAVTEVVNAGGAGTPASNDTTAPLDVVLTEGSALRIAGGVLAAVAAGLVICAGLLAFGGGGSWGVDARRRRSLVPRPEGAAGTVGEVPFAPVAL